MSAVPKFSLVWLAAAPLAALAADRLRKAAQEARRREEARERERQRRLQALRAQIRQELSASLELLERKGGDLPPSEVAAVSEELSRLKTRLSHARSEATLRDIQQALAAVAQRIERQADEEAARRAEILRRKATAEAAVGELAAVVEGLKADPVVMRWQYHRLGEIEFLANQAQAALDAEDWDRPSGLLAQAQALAAELVEKAGQAQLKADTRDYIARSIQSALTEMGYVVSEPIAAHPDHPASDLMLRGVDAAGRAIGVSVPVEGEVYYTVDGFPYTSEPLDDGGSAPACDQAEAVLNQMREHLARTYGVETGEILWEGKADPNRRLRKAEELPTSGEQRQSCH